MKKGDACFSVQSFSNGALISKGLTTKAWTPSSFVTSLLSGMFGTVSWSPSSGIISAYGNRRTTQKLSAKKTGATLNCYNGRRAKREVPVSGVLRRHLTKSHCSHRSKGKRRRHLAFVRERACGSLRCIVIEN